MTTLAPLAPPAPAATLAAMVELREKVQPNRLREMRERAGLSQAELGRLVDVDQQQIYRWEKSGDLKISTLRLLADALQCAEQDLIGAPLWASREGWTGKPGAPARLDVKLLARATAEAQTLLDRTGRKAGPDRFAALVAEIYNLAQEEAATYGVAAEEVDLRRFWRLMEP